MALVEAIAIDRAARHTVVAGAGRGDEHAARAAEEEVGLGRALAVTPEVSAGIA